MQGMDLPKCVYKMYQRIGSPRNFRMALAAGERLLSLCVKNQVGADVETVPNLCRYFGIGKTKQNPHLSKVWERQAQHEKATQMHNASSFERRGKDRRATSEES